MYYHKPDSVITHWRDVIIYLSCLPPLVSDYWM